MAKVKGCVIVNVERCKGCGVCTVACPFDVLALSKKEVNGKGYPFSESVKPEDCIGCANCAIVCPDSCITVYRERVQNT